MSVSATLCIKLRELDDAWKLISALHCTCTNDPRTPISTHSCIFVADNDVGGAAIWALGIIPGHHHLDFTCFHARMALTMGTRYSRDPILAWLFLLLMSLYCSISPYIVDIVCVIEAIVKYLASSKVGVVAFHPRSSSGLEPRGRGSITKITEQAPEALYWLCRTKHNVRLICWQRKCSNFGEVSMPTSVGHFRPDRWSKSL